MQPIHIGRWWIEYHRRAIHITAEPKRAVDPNCTSCRGQGGHGWITEHDSPDWEDCQCVEELHNWRIPLWRKPAPEAWPF